MDSVKHAMTRDEVDVSIIGLNPEKSLKSQTKTEDVDSGDVDDPPLKDDPTYAKYFKMLKMVSSNEFLRFLS